MFNPSDKAPETLRSVPSSLVVTPRPIIVRPAVPRPMPKRFVVDGIVVWASSEARAIAMVNA